MVYCRCEAPRILISFNLIEDAIKPVNPVPWIYVRGFGALPLQGGRNIQSVLTVLDRGRFDLSRRSWNGLQPRACARGVMSFDLEATLGPSSGRGLDRWYGVKGICSGTT